MMVKKIDFKKLNRQLKVNKDERNERKDKKVNEIKKNVEEKEMLKDLNGMVVDVKATILGGRKIIDENGKYIYLINLKNVEIFVDEKEVKLSHIHLKVDKNTYINIKKDLKINYEKETYKSEVFKCKWEKIIFQSKVESYNKNIDQALINKIGNEKIKTYNLVLENELKIVV